MTIKQLCKQAHKMAVEKGFWDKGICNLRYACDGCPISDRCPYDRNKSELLMLIVSELGEACEALRNNNRQPNTLVKTEGLKIKNANKISNKDRIWEKDTFEDEVADTFIRLGDMCEALGIDIEWQIQQKFSYNKQRKYKHGKEF